MTVSGHQLRIVPYDDKRVDLDGVPVTPANHLQIGCTCGWPGPILPYTETEMGRSGVLDSGVRLAVVTVIWQALHVDQYPAGQDTPAAATAC